MSATTPRKPLLSARGKWLCLLLMAAGAVLFLTAWLGHQPVRAWQAFLINWLFWSGMSQGGVVFAAILELTDSSWGRPMKRMAEALGAFLPFSLVLFLGLWPGLPYLYPWVRAPLPGLETWLAPGLVFGRDLLALLILDSVSFAYLYFSVRPDLGALTGAARPGAGLRAWLMRGWRGQEQEVARAQEKRRWLAPAVLITYGLVYSLLAFDLVMSLDPTWSSTLFGAYFLVVNLFGALALVAVLVIGLRKSAGLESAIGEPQFHDLGKLLFAFCLLALDFFWSQFLVIWYGDLPEETHFLIVRAYQSPWAVCSWTVVFGGLVLPFFLLLPRAMKAEPRRLGPVALWVVVMVWLERFVLVAPAVWPGRNLPLGLLEAALTAGFGALFYLVFTQTLDRIPNLPLTDPIFTGAKAGHHVLGEPEKWPS